MKIEIEVDNEMIVVVEIPHQRPVKAYFISARRIIYLAQTTTASYFSIENITDIMRNDYDYDEDTIKGILTLAENGMVGHVDGEYYRPSAMPSELAWAIKALYNDNHSTIIFDSVEEARAHEFSGHGRVEARAAGERLLGEQDEN
jgi:hypothetical protein